MVKKEECVWKPLTTFIDVREAKYVLPYSQEIASDRKWPYICSFTEIEMILKDTDQTNGTTLGNQCIENMHEGFFVSHKGKQNDSALVDNEGPFEAHLHFYATQKTRRRIPPKMLSDVDELIKELSFDEQ